MTAPCFNRAPSAVEPGDSLDSQASTASAFSAGLPVAAASTNSADSDGSAGFVASVDSAGSANPDVRAESTPSAGSATRVDRGTAKVSTAGSRAGMPCTTCGGCGSGGVAHPADAAVVRKDVRTGPGGGNGCGEEAGGGVDGCELKGRTAARAANGWLHGSQGGWLGGWARRLLESWSGGWKVGSGQLNAAAMAAVCLVRLLVVQLGAGKLVGRLGGGTSPRLGRIRSVGRTSERGTSHAVQQVAPMKPRGYLQPAASFGSQQHGAQGGSSSWNSIVGLVLHKRLTTLIGLVREGGFAAITHGRSGKGATHKVLPDKSCRNEREGLDICHKSTTSMAVDADSCTPAVAQACELRAVPGCHAMHGGSYMN